MNNQFFKKAGAAALGSRFRQVSERFTQEAAKIYNLYKVETEPRWFPLLYALAERDNQSVAQLAEIIGQSQASVSQVIKEMSKRDFVVISKADGDGRKTIITLTDKARRFLPDLQQQVGDVGLAVEGMLSEMQHNIWKALDELDYLLDQKNLFDRVKQQRKQRERNHVQIVPYSDQYHDAFRQLNQEWINTWFKLEEQDNLSLDHPEEKILNPGGLILMALYQGNPVGTCALIKMNDKTYELAKMAVSPKAQGLSIGFLLGQAIIEKARELKAEKVYLESNTILKPAISLYHKLGFQRVIGAASPYERCNIQMELIL